MVDAKAWILANRVKTGLGIAAALIPLVLAPISFVAWAEGMSEDQVRESEIKQQARAEVIYDSIRNKHAYDFYGQEAEDAEEDLVELEMQEAEGVVLLPSQIRKKAKLVKDIERFEGAQEQALERLSNPEDHDETSTDPN